MLKINRLILNLKFFFFQNKKKIFLNKIVVQISIFSVSRATPGTPVNIKYSELNE